MVLMARERQAHEVHGGFPFDLAAGAEVLLQLLELARHVAVVGLVNELGEKYLAMGHQFFSQRCGVLHERGVQAFEDVRIGFEGTATAAMSCPPPMDWRRCACRAKV